jgi:hypothetical protein
MTPTEQLANEIRPDDASEVQADDRKSAQFYLFREGRKMVVVVMECGEVE